MYRNLPSHSRELNPVENIWRLLRQNFLSNRVCDSYKAILTACCAACNALTAQGFCAKWSGQRIEQDVDASAA